VERIDAIVIGAGAVGLAVGRALAQAGHETIVLERERGIGQGVSSRNSEVIHAGLYYTPGSNKARFCVRGKQLLYELCAARGVSHAQLGKLVVATDASQHAALKSLQAKATANGVPVSWLTADEARALEPQLACTAALLSPTTGIVDSHGFMVALQGDLEHAGGMVALESTVLAADFTHPDGAVLTVRSGDSDTVTELQASAVVNAASLHATHLARNFRGLSAEHIPQEHYAKGSYYALAGKSPFRHLIYPAPDGAWLGVHLTLDLGGQAKFGPDLEWLATTDPDAIDYTVDPRRADGFYEAVRRYWPALPDGALQPNYSGVRPKIYAPGEPAADFRIDGPATHGVQGLVNLFGIESPGLTSAMAIGEQVAAVFSVSK
jgi:L-2-hydroxyglutarate oxidase LhgO